MRLVPSNDKTVGIFSCNGFYQQSHKVAWILTRCAKAWDHERLPSNWLFNQRMNFTGKRGRSKGAVPTHKHCLQFCQVLPPNGLIVYPANGPGHVAFVPHGKTPGGPTVFHAGSFPDQHPGMHPPAKPLPPLRIARGVPWNFRQREGFSREFLLVGAPSTEPSEEAT
jgi:hypothetical protein